MKVKMKNIGAALATWRLSASAGLGVLGAVHPHGVLQQFAGARALGHLLRRGAGVVSALNTPSRLPRRTTNLKRADTGNPGLVQVTAGRGRSGKGVVVDDSVKPNN